MQVVRMDEYKNREILSVLDHLASQARKGEIRGLAFCARNRNGGEEIGVSGDYRTDPAQAVNVACKMSWRLTKMQDEQEAGII